MSIATVVTITGQAWARDPDGNLRELAVGDVLEEGETLVTSSNGNVQLDFDDGLPPTTIGGDEEVAMTNDVDAENAPDQDETAAQDSEVEALLSALEEEDGDLLELLEATAAGGGAAGGGGGGSDFVQLARIEESVQGLQYEYAGGIEGGPDTVEFAEVPAGDEEGEADDTVAVAGITLDPITGDDTINESEAGQIITLTGSVTGDAGEGDTVTLIIGDQTYTGLVDADGNFAIDVDGDVLAANDTVDASVSGTDDSGNEFSADTSRDYEVDTTAEAGITINPVTADNTVNETEAGQVIAITGSVSGDAAEGDTVTLTIGENEYTGQVDADGNYSIDVDGDVLAENDTIDANVSGTDDAGNEFSADTTRDYNVDTTAEAGITIDPVTADNTINETEAGQIIAITGSVSGDAAEGDTVTLTIGENEYTGQVDADGNYSIDVDGDVLAENDTIDANVSGTDDAGNEFSADNAREYAVDTEASATISIDAITGDDVINGEEAREGNQVTITGSVTGDAAEGDTVTLNVGDSEYTGQVDADGNYAIEVDGDVLAANDNVRADVSGTDEAGNEFSADNAREYMVDTNAPEVVVTLGDDDAPLAAGEETSITIDFSEVAYDTDGNMLAAESVADLLSLEDIELVGELTQGSDTTIWTGTVVAAEGTNGDASATIADGSYADEAGNPGSEGSDDIEVDTTAPTVTVELEDATGDIYNAEEIADGVNATVTLGSSTEVDDTLVVVDGKNNELFNGLVTQEMLDEGLTVTITDLADTDTALSVTATVTDPAGNSNSDDDTGAIDATAPTVTVELEDATGDIYNAEEIADGVNATVTLGSSTEVDDTLVVVDGKNNELFNGLVTQEMLDDGLTVTITDLADTDTALSVTATVTDPAGNSNSDDDTGAIDATAPTVTVELEDATGDIYNAEEIADGVNATVTLGSSTEVDDTLVVVDGKNNELFNGLVTQEMLDDGLTVTITDLADTDTALSVTATVTDPAGNSNSDDDTGAIDATAPTVTVELEDATGDIYNAEEIADGVNATVTLGSSTEVDDTLVVVDGKNNELFNGLVTQEMLDDGLTVTITDLADTDTALSVTATVTDPAGNSNSDDDTGAIDATAPTVTVELEDATGDIYNAEEIADGVNATVTLGSSTEVDDTLVVVDGKNNELFNGLVTQEMLDDGLTVTITDLADTDTALSVTATVTDPAGNSNSDDDTGAIDATAPTVTVELEDATGDIYNAEEIADGVNATVTLGSSTEVDDTLVVVDGKNNELFNGLVTQEMLDDGLTVTITDLADTDTALSVTATVTDPAGNSNSDDDTGAIDATAPTVTVELEDATGDIYNAEEIADGVNATVTLGSSTEVDDTLVVVDGKNNELFNGLVTQEMLDDGLTVTITDLADTDTALSVTATVTDPAGNSNSDDDTGAIDATAPTVTVELEDATGDIYNAEEIADGVNATVTLGSSTEVDDTLVVVDGKNNELFNGLVTQEMLDDGLTVTITDLADTDTALSVTATVTDPAGNSNSDDDTGAIDATAPTVTVELEDATGDIYNAEEIADGVNATVTLGSSTEVDDTLVVVDGKNNELFNGLVTQEMLDDGLTVTITDLADTDTALSVTATVTDPAGNSNSDDDTGAIDATAPTVTVELEDATGDIYNAEEIADGVNATVTLGSSTEVDDTLVVVDGKNNELFNGLVTQEMLDDGLTVTITDLADTDTALSVTATVTDPAGNSNSDDDTGAIDTTAPIADPVLTAAEFGTETPEAINRDSSQVIFKTFTIGGGVDEVAGGGFEQGPTEFEENPSLGAVDTNSLETDLTFVLTSVPTFGTLYVDKDGSESGQEYVKANAEDTFKTDATLYWSVSKDELVEALENETTTTINGGSVDDWQSGEVDIYAYNIFGVRDESLLSVDGRGYLGVKDNTGTQDQVPDQLGHRGDGLSEELIFDFKKTVGEATVTTSNLIGSEGEVGSVEAFLNGESVGRWTFSNTGDAEQVNFILEDNSFTLEGVVFDQLRFSAEEYADGASKSGDSSDYFIQSIDYKLLPEAGYSYKAIDPAGNESEVVDVTINQPDASTQVPEGIVLPEDFIVATAAHTSGNGNTGNYANNKNGGQLEANAMEGSGSTVDVPKDAKGYYGVNHNSNGNNDNPDMIDGNEALLMQVAQPLTSMAFAIEGELNGATYSIFDSEGDRIGDPADMPATDENNRVEISSDTAFSYIAFDGSTKGKDKSEFSIKPVGYITDSGNEFVQGTSSNDDLTGGSSDDILVGGEGDDILFGGAGADTFAWNFGDEGTEDQPAEDTVRDFNASGNDEGDRLDLSDLLQERGDNDLDDYLQASENEEGDTVLHVSTSGKLGENGHGADQMITLDGVAYDQNVVQDMIDNGKLDIE